MTEKADIMRDQMLKNSSNVVLKVVFLDFIILKYCVRLRISFTALWLWSGHAYATKENATHGHFR